MAAAVLSALFICAFAHGQNAWLTMHVPARNTITPERLETHVGFLSDSLCQGRGLGTPGGSEAASWIARRFEHIGLQKTGGSWGRSFKTADGQTGHNIIGILYGSKRIPSDRYVIVGAHFDHLGILNGKIYHGADANASGAVAMTSIAEMLATTISIGRNYSHNVIFVGFDGKEMSMAGSQALWDMIRRGELKDPLSGRSITRDKIAFMVNIDQIGSTMSPLNEGRNDFLIMLGGSSIRRQGYEILKNCNSLYDLNMDISDTYYGSENFTKIFYRLSDQKVFVDNRIPAVMFTSGITMNTNKTWDKVETLDMEVLQKRIYLMYHWIEKML
ncbi:MAG: M28 family peptidase [Bacteroidales bacterium]|nr:M28 family peptidase [Bacteroidales bacterium]